MAVQSKRTVTKTRRKTRDLDQVQKDLVSKKHLADFKDSKPSEDLPGLGRHYCVECARWFDTNAALVTHSRGKPHKRRLRQLKEAADAEKRLIELTQPKGDANALDVDMAT